MFRPPQITSTAPQAPARQDKRLALATEKAEELRDELMFSTPDFAPADTFGGPVAGYVFSTRQGKTGYFRDHIPVATENAEQNNVAAARVPPTLPILLQAHVPVQPTDRQRQSDAKAKKTRRRDGHGPLPPCPHVTTLKEEDGWRKTGLLAIDSLNSNSFHSATTARATSSADALVLQETKVKKAKSDWIRAEARKDGWRAEMSAAAPAGGHAASGGVAVLVKSAYGLRTVPATELATEANRAVITETTFLGGCVLASVYLRHTEGPSPENLAIMDDVASSLAAAGPDWVMAMDANMPPEVMTASGWPDLLQAKLFHCNADTCGDANFDYFLVSNSLARLVYGLGC